MLTAGACRVRGYLFLEPETRPVSAGSITLQFSDAGPGGFELWYLKLDQVLVDTWAGLVRLGGPFGHGLRITADRIRAWLARHDPVVSLLAENGADFVIAAPDAGSPVTSSTEVDGVVTFRAREFFWGWSPASQRRFDP